MATSIVRRDDNLLLFTPRANIAWEQEQDHICLLVPKFKNAFLRKHLCARMRKPFVRVRLDEYGSYVWQHIDDGLTVQQIAEKLQEKFGDRVQPVYDRVGLFISMLYRNQFIVLEKK